MAQLFKSLIVAMVGALAVASCGMLIGQDEWSSFGSSGSSGSGTSGSGSALSLSPSTVTVVGGTNTVFAASGGSSPYTYSVAAGSGSVGAATGVYTAANSVGTATVRVTDALGAVADATVTIQTFNNYATSLTPAVYYRLNEAAGTTATDAIVAVASNGTLSGGYTLSQTGALTGDTDTAVRFDGVNARVQAAGTADWNFGISNFTILLWVKLNAGSCTTFPNFFSIYNAGGSQIDLSCHNVSHTLSSTMQATGNTILPYDTTFPTLDDGSWHLVGVKKSGHPTANFTYYMDGQTPQVFASGANNVSGGFDMSAFSLFLGRNGGGTAYWTNGTVDELLIYKSGLSDTQVRNLWCLGKGNPTGC